MSLKSRSAKNSAFLIIEGLKNLRYHASVMADDPASIERVIREADLLSQTCKKLASYADEHLEDTDTGKPAPARTGPRFDIAKLDRFFAAMETDTDTFCDTCGGLRY